VGGIVNELLDMRSHIDIAEMNRAALPGGLRPPWEREGIPSLEDRRSQKDTFEDDIMGAIL